MSERSEQAIGLLAADLAAPLQAWRYEPLLYSLDGQASLRLLDDLRNRVMDGDQLRAVREGGLDLHLRNHLRDAVHHVVAG